MANSNIFCNVPWTNTHLYWDGSFGACCNESQRPYDDTQWKHYNIQNMTIDQWHNSEPMKVMRASITGSEPLSQCKNCYYEETIDYESRRIKENWKTVIFTKQAFDKSYQQSSWYDRFESARELSDQAPPKDWHIDIGNECNLSCKMCNPRASSQIAAKYDKWSIVYDRRSNWTVNPQAWDNFLKSIDNIKINRLHIMGGEPLVNKRFFQLIDYLLEKGRTEISFSFVTNGTVYNQELVDKLLKFSSVDIEVSLEAVESNNHYIRQGLGTITDSVVENIKKLKQQETDVFKVVLRSVPQIFSIHNYHKYIKFAWDEQIAVQGIPLTRPEHLSIPVLPYEIRQTLIQNFIDTIKYIENNSTDEIATLATGRDTSRLYLQLTRECRSMITMLEKPEPANVAQLRQDLAKWMTRWDTEFNINANDFFPQYNDFFKNIGYGL